MPKVDLKQNYRYTDGRLYRAGKDVEVPAGFEAWRTGADKPAAVSSGGAGDEKEEIPYAELLAAKGFRTAAQIRGASDDELLGDGIGPARLREIREATKE